MKPEGEERPGREVTEDGDWGDSAGEDVVHFIPVEPVCHLVERSLWEVLLYPFAKSVTANPAGWFALAPRVRTNPSAVSNLICFRTQPSVQNSGGTKHVLPVSFA